tara:strand:- start:4548 stop:4766 length:219 start_codon:yes stop_codon:yes gene_type:complete
MTNAAAKLNALWNAAGKTVTIDDGTGITASRVIVSRRHCYGHALELTLSAPLPGQTSRLFTVDADNAWRVTA